MANERFKAKQVIEAIELAKGNLTQAARLLKCNRNTVYGYMNRYSTVKDAYERVNEETIDLVEDKLMTQIERGNITAIIFYLKTKAKHRGYVERQEFKHDGKVVLVNWDDANNGSD
jgi:hypothetical protein